MSAANNPYSMNSDEYEDERLLNILLLCINIFEMVYIYRICEITDVMNEQSEE